VPLALALVPRLLAGKGFGTCDEAEADAAGADDRVAVAGDADAEVERAAVAGDGDDVVVEDNDEEAPPAAAAEDESGPGALSGGGCGTAVRSLRT
jgi:hypothetical protein